MVMKVLRTTASGGIGKFILFGFLVLAVAGLALMDIGGFFRGGTGSNNVIKIDGQTVSIGEFDREVRRQLSPLGISPQDAYKMGYMNQIIAGEIRKILLEKLARDSGLEIDHERIAAHIASLIKPLSNNGEQPDAILRQILRSQGMSEQQFSDAIRAEMEGTLLNDAVNTAAVSEALIDGLYQFQAETRDIGYLKFNDSEITITPPSDDELQAYYDSLREMYKIPETRNLQVLLLDDSDITKDVSLNAAAILDKKYERVEQLEDLLATDLTAEEINQQVPVKIFTLEKIAASGDMLKKDQTLPAAISDNLKTIAEEAFTLDSGEASSALEFDGAQFAAIRVTDIQPQDYRPLEDVKTKLSARWSKEKQHAQTLERVQEIIAALQESGGSLEDYAKANKRTYRTAKALSRGAASAPFAKPAVNGIFDEAPATPDIAEIEGGAAIVTVTQIHQPERSAKMRQSETYKALKNALATSNGEEALGTILEDMHNQTPALVNYKLLERIYGESSQYY